MRILSTVSVLVWGALLGCSDEGGGATARGPEGGILEVDNQGIPLGEKGGSSGSGSLGGSGGSSGGKGGTGGSGGTFTVGGKPNAGPTDIGKACEEDSDCQGGLRCRRDPTNFISHLQCSMFCDTSEQCENLDASSFCIGANACVHACNSAADCGPKTRCNSSGWCERKGPGSGVSFCTGSPLPCALQSHTGCLTTLGCQDDSECNGVSSSCYSQFDSFSCNQQDGCFWSSSSQSCSGVARSCSSLKSSSLACNDQEGCFYSERCAGTALTCESLSTSLCTSQPGCSIEEG